MIQEINKLNDEGVKVSIFQRYKVQYGKTTFIATDSSVDHLTLSPSLKEFAIK